MAKRGFLEYGKDEESEPEEKKESKDTSLLLKIKLFEAAFKPGFGEGETETERTEKQVAAFEKLLKHCA
jgi:hypothetical protein